MDEEITSRLLSRNGANMKKLKLLQTRNNEKNSTDAKTLRLLQTKSDTDAKKLSTNVKKLRVSSSHNHLKPILGHAILSILLFKL